MVELLLKTAALMLSFLGLCEAVRNLLRVNRFIAPSVAAGGIIIVLMVAGILDALLCGVWLLYAAGWIYWVYNLLAGRRRPDWLIAAICVCFAAILTWQLWSAKMIHPDDFSHWGLAVESLLRRNAFPDASERVITYQSYPMGATVFVYYVARMLGHQEGLRFIAQNFLCGILLLPIFAFVREGKWWKRLAAAALFVTLYKFNRSFEVLQVDWLQSYFGVAIASAALCYRDDLKKATLTALPCLIAVAVTKNSGLFFSAAGALMLIVAADRSRCTKKQLWTAAALAIGLPVAMYLLWTLHVKFKFPAGFESKHAVSIDAYAQIAGEKSLRTILLIGWKMIRWWLRQTYVTALTAGFAVACWALTRRLYRAVENQREVRRLAGWLLACLVVFVLWHAMLFVMYVFSMPLEEAQSLASYSRYTTAGLILPLGMAMVGLLDFFVREGAHAGRRIETVWAVVVLACAIMLPLLTGVETWLNAWGRTEGSYFATRSEVLWAKEQFALREDDSYLILADDGRETELWGIGYRAKYDLYSADMLVAMLMEDGSMNVYTATEREIVEDAAAWLKEKTQDCDAVLLLSEDERCERLLEQCAGDVPVINVVGKRVEAL